MKLYPNPAVRPAGPYPHCTCFNMDGRKHPRRAPLLHSVEQDQKAPAWADLLQRVEDAARQNAEEFTPLEGLSGEDRATIVTLPPSIATLTTVRRLNLYGSHLTRLPPELGQMRSLVSLDVYTSRCLHYLPFEVTRCQLRESRMSTRALYGNYKFRAPFPDLEHSRNVEVLAREGLKHCSVCDAALVAPAPVVRWITLRVGTDWVPLLVAACSTRCISSLPTPPAGYVPYPHTGGADLQQPPCE